MSRKALIPYVLKEMFPRTSKSLKCYIIFRKNYDRRSFVIVFFGSVHCSVIKLSTS
ncbi:MAG: hypothetical protein K0S61_4287 [Anaerocolumna sp.]|jgi:hypothetical protein|nr:hypothetical protein [Anaerocolumna sp.]